MKLVKYPNLTLFGFSILAAVVLAWLGIFERIFSGLGELGYLGAFIAGVILPFTFAAPMATVSFFYLGEFYNPVAVALWGGLGAVLADLLIFYFFKGGFFKELEVIWGKHGQLNHPRRHAFLVGLFHTKLFHFISLFTAGLLILSPFPDEIGIAVFTYYKLPIKKLVPLSFLLNSIGIWIIVGAGYLAAQ